jgi:GNAT superfamily N-acetyltransferase
MVTAAATGTEEPEEKERQAAEGDLAASLNRTELDPMHDLHPKCDSGLNRSTGESMETKPEPRIVRLTVATDQALVILQEYYDAVHVIQRDTPGSVQEIVDAPGSGVWLAYLGEEVVGCVVLRKLRSIPSASECKRLYVKPSARGNRIADQLLDAQEDYARSQGINSIYLDSFDDLKTAIALYERRGYERCERYNDNPQATLYMRKRLGSAP